MNQGEKCHRTACNNLNAQWFNHSTQMYYCQECAVKINRLNPEAKEMYGHDLCTLSVKQPNLMVAITNESVVTTFEGDVMIETKDRNQHIIIGGEHFRAFFTQLQVIDIDELERIRKECDS